MTAPVPPTAAPPPPDALAFDLGNVLIRVDHLRFCRRLGELARVPAEEVHARIFLTDLEPAYDTGRLTSREFHREVVKLFDVRLPYPTFRHWWVHIFDPMPDMVDLVARLAKRHPLYLVSNTNPLHFAHVRERFPLVRHFKGYILSYRVKSRKPEPEIYQALIRRAGRPPKSILFIDDKMPFVTAARQLGLTAWHFTSPREFIRDLKLKGLY